jgi:hypothetical protein
VRHDFDPNVIKAQVMAYHMTHHQAPGEKMGILNCHLEYSGGDTAVIMVPFESEEHQGGRFYVYDLSTSEIDDFIGDLKLPR